MKGVIYRLVFPDGKYYIGSTINKIYDRMYCHKRDCANGHKSKLYEHWKKFNQLPTIEILEEVEIHTLNDLHRLERFYVQPIFEDDECLNSYIPALTAKERRDYNRFNALHWRTGKNVEYLE